MPVYEYYCPTCKSEFAELRPMRRVADPAHCPVCETQSWKKLSLFSLGPNMTAEGVPVAAGGGCACGGNCACGA